MKEKQNDQVRTFFSSIFFVFFFLQVVWSTSNKVGCGIARCNFIQNSPYFEPSYVMACNYGPTGNWRGQRPYKTGPKCSQCPEGRQLCIQGLCFPGKARQTRRPEPTTSVPQTEVSQHVAPAKRTVDRSRLNGKAITILMKSFGILAKRVTGKETEKQLRIKRFCYLLVETRNTEKKVRTAQSHLYSFQV